MLRDAFFIACKDTGYLFRRRETWAWAFVIPIVITYFVGTVFKSFSAAPGAREIIAAGVPADAGFLAEHLLRRLEARNYQVVRAGNAEELSRYQRQLIIPPGFTESVLAGKPVKVHLKRTGGGLSADHDRIRVARAVYTTLADLIVAAKDGAKPTPEALARVAAQPRTLKLEVESAGRRIEPPSGFEQSVPGAMVMFTLMVLFNNTGVWLVIERNLGILRRLASTPMSRGAVLLGKLGARMSLGVVQIAFAMLTGSVLFGVRWGPHLPAVAAVMLVYAALAACLGLLVGNFLRTDRQVIAVGVLSTNILAALGGCWWPVEVTPLWTQKLALCLPTGWAMDALHKLVNFGASPAAVIPHLIALSLSALAAGWAVARSFRFQ